MASKNLDRLFVRCIECKHATFKQWYENPVIAFCSKEKERFVANSKRVCKLFTASNNSNPPIVHYDDYREALVEIEREFFDDTNATE